MKQSFTTFDPSCSALSPSASIGSYWKPNQGVCQIRGKFDGRSALTLIDPANPSKGVTINYEDGETEGISPTSTKLDIVCDTTESAACADGMCKKGSPTGGIQIHIVIKSPKACPSSGRGLLWPVGILGILLILVIIAFIAYWPIGLVVNKFIRKKEGIEIVPNIALWKDLPFLVKDGFLFLFKDIIYDRIIAKIIEFIKSKRGGGGGAAYESA